MATDETQVIQPDDENPSSIELEGPPPFPDFPPPPLPVLTLPQPETLIPQPEGVPLPNNMSAPPMSVGQPQIITVPLFESAHGGYGDADAGTRPFTYNRCSGTMDTRWPGRISPGFIRIVKTSGATESDPVFASEWEDASSLPLTYWLQGVEIRYLQSASGGTEVGADVLGSVATSGMFDDDGSGVAYIYAGFGDGTKIRRMNRARTVSEPAEDIYADLFLSSNGRAYRSVTPPSGTANSAVSTCPAAGVRFTISDWSGGERVGFAGTNINALLSVRQAPVAIKPEGIFAYSESLDRWVNYTPGWSRFQHPDNGKGAFSLGDHAIIPMGDGGVVLFNGFTVIDIDPIPQAATPNVHTTTGMLMSNLASTVTRATLGTTRNWLLAITQPGSKAFMEASTNVAVSPMQFKYFNDSSGTYTNGNDDVFSGNPTDKETFSYDDTADFIYVGWYYPFCGITYDPGIGGTVNDNASVLTVEIYDGSSWVTINSSDGTDVDGDSLKQKGLIAFTEDPFDDQTWTQVSVDGRTRYWARLSWSNVLTNSVTWNTCSLVPWYPSVDPSVNVLENEGLDRGGLFSHLLMGKLDLNTGSVLWHDMGTIGILAASALGTSAEYRIITNAPAADYATDGISIGAPHERTTVLISRTNIVALLASPDDRTGTLGAYPTGMGFFEGAAIRPANGKSCKLVEIRVQGEGFDDILYAQLYYTWDSGKPWTRCGSRITRAPSVIHVPTGDEGGVKFRWGVFFQTGSAFASQVNHPQITGIEADFEVVPRELDTIQERPMPSIEATEPPRI